MNMSERPSPLTSDPNRNVWVDAVADSLNETISSRLPPMELQDKLRQQVKEHREYLESLMDRAIKVLYFIGAFIVGGAAILGFKTYWDIDDRLKKGAEDQVNKYIDRDFIKLETTKRINEYNAAAVIAYLTIQATDPKNINFVPTEFDLDVIQNAIKDPASPYFEGALKIVASFKIFRERYARSYGGVLLSLLQGQQDRNTKTISVDSQENMILTLRALGYSDATPFLLASVDNNNTPIRLQLAALKAIPNLAESGEKSQIAARLMTKISEQRERNRDLYTAKLTAATKLDLDAALSELTALSAAKSPDDAHSFVSIMNESLVRRTFYTGEEAKETKVVDAISTFFLSEIVYLSLRDYDNMGFGYRPTAPSVTIWVRTGPTSASGSDIAAPDSQHRLLPKAVIRGLSLVNTAKIDQYVGDFVSPIVDLGATQFNYEKSTGMIGSNANPLQWRDGFTYVDPSKNSGIPMLITKFDKTARTLMAIGRPEERTALETYLLPVSSIDIAQLKWEPRSYTSQVNSPFARR